MCIVDFNINSCKKTCLHVRIICTHINIDPAVLFEQTFPAVIEVIISLSWCDCNDLFFDVSVSHCTIKVTAASH